MIMKRLGKIAAWIIAMPLGLLVFCYLVLLAINYKDQPPSPAAISLDELLDGRQPVANEDNAFIYFMGFSADRDDDPRVSGLKRINQLKESLSQSYFSLEQPDEPEGMSAYYSPLVKDMLERCRRFTVECEALVKADAGNLAKWGAENAWIFSRYQVFISHNEWRRLVPYSQNIVISGYSAVVKAHTLYLAMTLINAPETDSNDLAKLLDNDMRFWRRVLASSDELLTKMIAAAAITKHFQWASAIISQHPDMLSQGLLPSSWLEGFSKEELSLHTAMAGEWRFMTTSLNLLRNGQVSLEDSDRAVFERWAAFFLSPLLLVGDTSNTYAEQVLRIKDALQTDYKYYPDAAASVTKMLNDMNKRDIASLVSNPIGKLTLSLSDIGFIRYSNRVYDLEGIRRMALAMAQIRGKGVSLDNLQQALDISVYNDPYTGEPFQWDASQAAIRFDGLGARGDGGYLLRY
jgi:hypothetical protein